jgi:polynucleotide 5'-kinase involved in rRNA processing
LVLVTKEKIGLEAKVEELTAALPKNIELEKIVVKSTQELTGKVLSLDKERGFIVVDLGNDNNLKLGDVLSVYRDDKFIGKAQVEKIEEKTSAAVILTPWKEAEFKESDVVKRI